MHAKIFMKHPFTDRKMLSVRYFMQLKKIPTINLTRLVSPSSATRFVWHLLNKLNLMARFIDQISGIFRPQRLARCAISSSHGESFYLFY
jgi:hypothetical protein